MDNQVLKAQTSYPHPSPSKFSEGKPTDVVTENRSKASRSPREQSQVDGDLAHGIPSGVKRQHDTAFEVEPLRATRPRLTQTDAQPSGDRCEEAEQIVQTDRQHPRPESKRQYDTFCEPTTDEQEQVSPAKRGIGNDSEQQPKRTRLTRKNLALFDKMANKKPTNAPDSESSTTKTTTTKTTSTTSSGFVVQASKNGILQARASKPPTNLDDLRKRYARSRDTPSPPESLYESYVDEVTDAVNEATMVFEVGSKLLNSYPDKGYRKALNKAFTAFPKDVGFNNKLSAPQPDFVQGLTRIQYFPFFVDEYVKGAVLHKDVADSITLPHLAGEWKAGDKGLKTAEVQSAYDGAALVYARDQALTFTGEPQQPGHAEVTTFTTNGSILNIYAHYSTVSENGTLEYHQYPITSTMLTFSYQGFKAGRRELRNAQDYAKERSYVLKDQLVEHWKLRQGGLQSTGGAPGGEPSSTTSANKDGDKSEDKTGYEMVEQSREPTPPTSPRLECLSEHEKASSSRYSSPTSLPPVGDCGSGNSAQKRKASSPEELPRKSSKPNGKGEEF
ncbi:hypothetical protein F5Y10DRAFT_270728 [Nemania abortiva]|nr:hypothetical protein F5Y10DRAFT_270728 [Nemania abortiva]